VNIDNGFVPHASPLHHRSESESPIEYLSELQQNFHGPVCCVKAMACCAFRKGKRSRDQRSRIDCTGAQKSNALANVAPRAHHVNFFTTIGQVSPCGPWNVEFQNIVPRGSIICCARSARWASGSLHEERKVFLDALRVEASPGLFVLGFRRGAANANFLSCLHNHNA